MVTTLPEAKASEQQLLLRIAQQLVLGMLQAGTRVVDTRSRPEGFGQHWGETGGNCFQSESGLHMALNLQRP